MSKQRIVWFLLTIASVAATTLVFAKNAERVTANSDAIAPRPLSSGGSSGRPLNANKDAPNSGPAPVPQASGPVQMVRFSIYDDGFFPREVRVNMGTITIRMEDLSGNSAGLVVKREAGKTIGQIARTLGKWRGSARISLTPGRYQVFEVSRPNNKATLIVEP
jgi:hypothetical protein